MSGSVTAPQSTTRRSDPQRSKTTPVPQASRPVRPPLARLQAGAGNRTVHRLLTTQAIQPQLTVGPVDDEYEREADRAAVDVMRMPNPVVDSRVQRAPIRLQRLCTECQQEEEDVQRKPASAFSGAPLQLSRKCPACEEEQLGQRQTAPAIEDEKEEEELPFTRLQGGTPIATTERSFFERRMGHDFGAVRIHAGARADKLARSVDARAFAYGPHLVFRAGAYAPQTTAGRSLLAHELTHTIQQGVSPPIGQTVPAEAIEAVVARKVRTAAPRVQRVCETRPPPADLKSALGCDEATTSAGTGTNIMFAKDSPGLSAGDQATLSSIAAAWHAGGGVAFLRVDGFASCEGPADRNWRLSCRRATAVAVELEAPSDGSPGIPVSHLEILANGETDRFGRTLAPNRRVVVTGGGTPPPGPPCGLTITGPNDVDHYCAAYVPSDAVSCGVFPAPNITLTGGGAAAPASLRWSITRGAGRASIVGTNTAASVTVRGDAPSVTQGDVTVQVTDGSCTTTHFLTVREPSSMPATTVASSGPTFVQILVTYTVLDQFGNPMGPNICWDETVTTCADNQPGPHAKGDIGTNATGQVIDRLNVSVPTGTLSATMCKKFNQVITVGGCGPLAQNTIVFQASGAALNQGASCAAGATCP